jgi:hypothetical protein
MSEDEQMKYILLFLVISLVLFTSCTVDDGTPKDNNKPDNTTPDTSGIDDIFSNGDGITPPPIPS